VIEKLQHNEMVDVSIDNDDIWMEEDINKTCQLVTEDPQFRDVPSVLVDDDDSMLFPCNNMKNDTVDESDQSKYKKKMEKICKENKARVRLCKTLLGNGIIDLLQLETKITSNLLCLQCVMEQMYGLDSDNGYMIDECGVIVRTIHRGFACTVTVECVWRHHMFSIEPERVQHQSCVNDDTKETTMLENEMSIDNLQHDVPEDPIPNDFAMDPAANNNSNDNLDDVSPVEIGNKDNTDDNTEHISRTDNVEMGHSMTMNLNTSTNKTELVTVSRKKKRQKKLQKQLDKCNENIELVNNDDTTDNDTTDNVDTDQSVTTNLNTSTNKTESVTVSRKKR